MKIDIQVGTDIGLIAEQLKDFGRDDLRREFVKGVKDAVRPTQRQIKAGVGAYMPTGYTDDLKRDMTVTTSVRTTGNAKVTVTGRSGQSRLNALNKGRLRHPLFGNRDKWYSQRVRPGFFTDPLFRSVPDATRRVERAMQDALDRIG